MKLRCHICGKKADVIYVIGGLDLCLDCAHKEAKRRITTEQSEQGDE